MGDGPAEGSPHGAPAPGSDGARVRVFASSQLEGSCVGDLCLISVC